MNNHITTEFVHVATPPAVAEIEQTTIASPHLIIRPRSGWSALDLRELWRYRELLLIFGLRDVKLRYRQTFLGVTWVLLQPLLAAGIFGFVFGTIAQLPSEGLPYFLFAYTGLLGWNAFQSNLTKASSCVLQSSNLISKVYFPRMILPISTSLSTLIDFAVALALLGVILPFWVTFGPRLLLVPVWLGMLFLMSLGLGLLAAALMVAYRDVQYIVPVLVQLGLFATPVAYGMSAVPERYRFLLLFNPLTGPLEGLRWSLLGTTPPSWECVVYSTVCAILVFLGGTFLFKRMERSFADVI